MSNIREMKITTDDVSRINGHCESARRAAFAAMDGAYQFHVNEARRLLSRCTVEEMTRQVTDRLCDISRMMMSVRASRAAERRRNQF